MTSSGKFPNVTLRKPPMPGPVRSASSSVARPIRAAVGITPRAAAPKMSEGDAPATSSAIATGMNGTRKYGQPEPLRRKRSTAPKTRRRLAAEQRGALLHLGRDPARLLEAVEVLLRVA